MANFVMPILWIALCSFISLELRFADAGYERFGSPSYTEAEAEVDLYGYGDFTEQRQPSQVLYGTPIYLSESGHMIHQGQTLSTPVTPSLNVKPSLEVVQLGEQYVVPPVDKSFKKRKELIFNVLFIILSICLVYIARYKLKGSAVIKGEELEIEPGKEKVFVGSLIGFLLGLVLTVVSVAKFLIFLIRLAYSKFKEAFRPSDSAGNIVGHSGQIYAPMGMYARSGVQ